MALATCTTGMMTCTFGIAPMVLNVLPTTMTFTKMPYANIMANIPMANIPPFGMCNCPSNPMFIAATAAKLGVPTPVPCIPVTPAPWFPGSPTVLAGKLPSLNSNANLMCIWPSLIKLTFPGQVNVMVTG